MESLLPLIIQIVSGMIGGGVAGGMLKNAAMSMLPKLLAGGIGGIGGAGILASVMGGGDASSMMDMGNLINNVGGGLVGGGVLTGIAGMVMGAMKK